MRELLIVAHELTLTELFFVFSGHFNPPIGHPGVLANRLESSKTVDAQNDNDEDWSQVAQMHQRCSSFSEQSTIMLDLYSPFLKISIVTYFFSQYRLAKQFR